MKTLILFLILVAFTPGQAREVKNGELKAKELRAFEQHTGVYLGSFHSALTPSAHDDINHSRCPIGEICIVHRNPHKDVVFALGFDETNMPMLQLYGSEDDFLNNSPKDLLGWGCGSQIGELKSIDLPRRARKSTQFTTLVLQFRIQAGMCGAKLLTGQEYVTLKFLQDEIEQQSYLVVNVPKEHVDNNYMYIRQNGERVRAKLTGVKSKGAVRDGFSGYQVCFQAPDGEWDDCLYTRKEKWSFILPIGFGGGPGVTAFWGRKPNVKLKFTNDPDLIETSFYSGSFFAIDPIQ